MMLDHAVRVLFDEPYDVDGAIAASGQVIAAAPLL
jgi:1,6-anhydro-N-acetylmuramate kinase